MLLREKGHYVQAINYPTVPVGEEKLRLAPTPHHTISMMDILVQDMVDIWHEKNLPLKGMACPPVCSVQNIYLPSIFMELRFNLFFFAFIFVHRNVHFVRNLYYSTGANREFETSTRRWILVYHFVAHYQIVRR